MKERRQYCEALKSDAVRMVTQEGLSYSEAGQKLGIPKGTIGSRMAHFREEGCASIPGTPNLAEILVVNIRLRKELAEVKMKREILKKATAYFAKEILPGIRS